MADKRTRKRVLEDDLVTNDSEIADFLAAFGHRPAKRPVAVRAKVIKVKPAAAKKPQVRCLAEAVWLQQVHAAEKEDRRRERAGLPPVPCVKTWDEIRDGEIIPSAHC
jgi:hypothetical protein